MAVLLTAPQVAEKLGISTGSLYRRIRKGVVPPPYSDGKYSRWLADEVDCYLIYVWHLPHEVPESIGKEAKLRIKTFAERARARKR